MAPRRKAGGEGGVDTVGPTQRRPLRAAKGPGELKNKPTEEEETYRVQNGWVNFRLSGSFYFKGINIL